MKIDPVSDTVMLSSEEYLELCSIKEHNENVQRSLKIVPEALREWLRLTKNRVARELASQRSPWEAD